MRVTFVGHACHLVETDDVRVLTDPWLCDTIFGGHVEHDPPLGFGIADLPEIHVLAITHGHLDHFNAPTLARWPDKSVPVVIPTVRFSELEANLRRLGFPNVHPLDDWKAFELRGARVVATPSLGVLDECAWVVVGRDGAFFDGADAPQPPELMQEIAKRLGPVVAGAFSHNSFDQPSLLGLPSHKPADHAPRAAAAAAASLGVAFGYAGASNLRWTGPRGAEITRKVIRAGPEDFRRELAATAPEVAYLDLRPGDAWSLEGGIERDALGGTPEATVPNDYLHAFLDSGERFCPAGRPSVADTFARDLPARLARAPEASRYLGQPVSFEITGEGGGTWSVDFSRVDAAPVAGDDGAPFAVRIEARDWLDLFERRISWQVLLVSDRLAITRFRPGPPPDGLHFAYALQAVFP
ncbi:MAG: hypothetical protein HKP30_03265 [Myxococcales bacterium]|nr:hypothetical protein [Myxococcales bacterium]